MRPDYIEISATLQWDYLPLTVRPVSLSNEAHSSFKRYSPDVELLVFFRLNRHKASIFQKMLSSWTVFGTRNVQSSTMSP
jgi:hypothetical protein